MKSKSQKKVIKPRVTKKKNPLVVGVASDAAFGFYYPDDIEEIERLGCRVMKIDLISQDLIYFELDLPYQYMAEYIYLQIYNLEIAILIPRLFLLSFYNDSFGFETKNKLRILNLLIHLNWI